MKTPPPERVAEFDRERRALLHQLERMLEIPMLLLGMAWLALLILELTAGEHRTLLVISTGIWIVFILEFVLRFTLAPGKRPFLKKNWLTLLSLIVPAFRLLRAFRLARLLRTARAIRGLRLFRLVAGLNRGLRSLRTTMGRRGFGYVLLFAGLVTFVGAAGMFAFERDQDPGLRSYSAALWWTAMMMTTVGSDYFPRSPEGRLLCLMIATVAFALWGYLTATLASFFLGGDKQ